MYLSTSLADRDFAFRTRAMRCCEILSNVALPSTRLPAGAALSSIRQAVMLLTEWPFRGCCHGFAL
jgi:hypothetical protein